MKLTRTFAFSLVAAGLLAGCGMSTEERFAKAETAYASHLFGDARIHLTNVLQEEPGNARAMEMLARTFLVLNDPVAAAGILDRMKSLGKLPADYPLLKAEADMMMGRYDSAIKGVADIATADAFRIRALAAIGNKDNEAAIAAFEAGARAPGNAGRLLADYAHFRLAAGDTAQAKELAAKAAAIKPRTLASYLVSADIAVAEEKPAEALAAYETTLRVYPESRAALLGKVGVLGGLGKIKELRPLVDEALEKAPNDADLIYLKARIAAEDGKWNEVRDILQPHERQLENLPLSNALYAKALLEMGQTEQARVRLKSQLLRDPSDRQVRMMLAETELAANDPKGAVATLRPVASRTDATSEELKLITRAAKAAGIPDAKVLPDQLVQVVPQEIADDLARGDAALKAGNWSGAITAYNRIMARTDGRNVLVLNNLAYAYSRAGNRQKALGYAESALKIAPDNASVMDTTGWLLFQTGKDRQRALTLLRKAVKLAPDNGTIRAHLARAEQG